MAAERNILVIDDDVDFTCLLQLAFQQAGIPNRIDVINDGWAVVDYLERLSDDSQSPKNVPAFVLLDWRMPGVCGLDLLRKLRSNASTCEVPIVVLSGILSDSERAQAKAFGAASIQDKPFSYRDLVQTAQHLGAQFLVPTEIEQVA